MPDSLLGDGLIFEDSLPMAWLPGALPKDSTLTRLNADNWQLLGSEASLDDMRVNEALKDESPALVHELQRLEFKLNVLLRLASELARQNSALPPPRQLKLSSRGAIWLGEGAPSVGDTGVLDLYINSTLPQPLKLPSTVIAAGPGPDAAPGPGNTNSAGGARLQFSGLSEQVVDLIEKFIFRQHRRMIAGARLAPNPAT
jgi:hypothetical protein